MNLQFGKLVLATAVLLGSAGTAISDDLGEKVFKRCVACHAIGEKAKNGVGPRLNGLAGRSAGAIEGFRYTPANKNSGITWDEETFKEYIKNPRAKIPGTSMVFVGIKKEEEIDALWNYLKQFGPDGKKQ